MAPIIVVGGGAVGLLAAGKLSVAGLPVEVWTRTAEQADLLAGQGIELRTDTSARTATVGAVPLPEAKAAPDSPVLLAVKQTALTVETLSQLSRRVPAGATLVCLCNGIGHVEKLEDALPGVRLAAVLTTEGALRQDGRTVVHTGRGTTWIGPGPRFDAVPVRYAASPDETMLIRLESWLKQAGFDARLSNNMAERMLRKLLVNAVVNPLTALLRVRNGELTATPERLRLMRALHNETAAILHRCGLPQDPGLWDDLLDVCSRTAANRSSMLQDALNGNRTEIDAINGAVVRLAGRLGSPAPWNEKAAALVEAISGV